MSLVSIVVTVPSRAAFPDLHIFATLARNYGIHYEGFSHMCCSWDPLKTFEYSSYVDMSMPQMDFGNYIKRLPNLPPPLEESDLKLGHTFQLGVKWLMRFW